ncbi:MAG: hypothetical protein K1X72_04975 [Pyrinomonadaceae bacterium]|nr:hypothetical protein [Pyrinomonadaceae bacterium]
MKNLSALIILCAAFCLFNITTVLAQDETEPTTVSNLTDANLPWDAQRVLPGKMPAEFDTAFENLLKEGNGKITGGNREVLLWSGKYKNRKDTAKITSEIQTNFRKAGWKYETAGNNDSVEFFTLVKDSSPRQVVLGFFVSGNDLAVCALMEVMSSEANSLLQTGNNNQPTTTKNNGGLSIYGKWFRTLGGSSIDYTGKTKLKSGEDFTFQFFADGTVEYTRKKEVLSIMQCHINESQNARGKFTISGNTLTINLGAMRSVGTNSCDAKGNFNKTLENSTMTVKFEIKKMEDITRPDKPTIMCFDGNEVCYERQP